MAFVALGLLLAIAAVAIGYPLFSPDAVIDTTQPVTDGDVQRAVRRLRAARSERLRCPACGHAYQAGDQFCVQCGADLPGDAAPAPVELTILCANCGTPLRETDIFCSKCGHRVAAGEESS